MKIKFLFGMLLFSFFVISCKENNNETGSNGETTEAVATDAFKY